MLDSIFNFHSSDIFTEISYKQTAIRGYMMLGCQAYH